MSIRSSLFKTVLCVISAVFLSAALSATAAAQTGRITGTVTDSARVPLVGAQIAIPGSRVRAVTDDSGRFVIGDLAAGTYDLRAQRIGQIAQTISGVVVRPGQDTRVDVRLPQAALTLAGMVVSASRRPEKVTDAPATITRIDASAIENTVGNSFAPALKSVKGLDFIQVGVTSVAVNARGFNSSFNNRMLMMEDNRIAVLPENGLPVGALTPLSKLDLASIEVLVGPGSALYGPDASNGVISLQSKDPRDYPGTSIEAAGGSRSFYDVQGRHAGVANGKIGYTISGEYQSAKDWQNKDIYAPIVTGGAVSPEIGADWNTNVLRGHGALVYYFPTVGRLELNAGASKTNGIGQTSVGRNQLVNWQYREVQAKYSHPNWFAQVYHTQSLSGDTYQINGFSQNRLRYPTITDDSAKHLSDFPAEGQLSAAEIQNTFTLPAMLPTVDGIRITWGGQFRRDQVSSMRQWLTDRQTGEDITINQKGVYGQADIPITSWLRGVVAGRYDKHDYYDAQFSPKAGILVTPVEDQTFRLTFNRAFKSPTVLQTSFFFPDFAPFVGVFGNKDGYVIKNSAGAVVNNINPIVPETNDTWELGYKGIIQNKLYLDVTGYHSKFKKFMSPLVIIANFANPASAGGPTFAFNAKTGAQLTGSTGGPQIPLTYFNVGDAKIYGTDIGVRYLITPTIAFSGTTSLQKLDTIYARAGDPLEATAFNSPTSKANVGMDFSEIGTKDASAGFTIRYVNGYDFRSGINVGHIPTFDTFDFTAGYRLPAINGRINLSVQNLFSCRSGTSTIDGWLAATKPLKYTPDSKCGFGQKHIEMINMPEIGTMVFLGLRLDL
jgi:outer membrane receptor for ferrienterochelin and colicins